MKKEKAIKKASKLLDEGSLFAHSFKTIARRAAKIAESKGWYIHPNDPDTAMKIALMHSELSEALEALRKGDPESTHIPGFSGMGEEFADVIIRIMHLSLRLNLDVENAILAKLNFNETRPYQHGNKRF